MIRTIILCIFQKSIIKLMSNYTILMEIELIDFCSNVKHLLKIYIMTEKFIFLFVRVWILLS